jgi:hypothetical protein
VTPLTSLRGAIARPRRLAAALTVAATAAGLSGCGGGEDPKQVLDKAFRTPIGSADVSMSLSVRLQGIPNVPQPIRVSLSGPYQTSGSKRIPRLDFRASLAAGPRSFNGRVVSTADNLFVGTQDRMYEVGKEQVAQANRQLAQQQGDRRTLASFGVDPRNWLTDAKTEDDVTVAGVQTTHVTGKVDVTRMLEDLNKVAQRAAGSVGGSPGQLPEADRERVERVVKEPQLDVYVGKDDDKVRRVAAKVTLDVPEEDRSRLNGLQSGDVNFNIELANVGDPKRVAAPPNPRPFSELQEDLQGLLGGLGAGIGGAQGGQTPGGADGGQTPTPGGGGSGASDADAERLRRYAQCIEDAGDNQAAQRRCAEIIR